MNSWLHLDKLANLVEAFLRGSGSALKEEIDAKAVHDSLIVMPKEPVVHFTFMRSSVY